MSQTPLSRSIEAHKRWLGYLQPDGLVVSAAALVDKGHYYQEAQRERQLEFIDHLLAFQKYDEEEGTVEITDFKALATDFLSLPEREWVDAADLGDSYHIQLKESPEVLSPSAALRWPRSKELAEGEPAYQLLIKFYDGDLDAPYETAANTWSTSATRRLERLLRETGIPIGLLVSRTQLRLVSAPVGENAGSLTFRFADMVSTMGRPILGAFDLLFSVDMLFLGEESHQLPALLRHSRDMQANVSVELAGQVLDGLYDLVRGTQAADARTGFKLLQHLLATNPDRIYEGQLTVLMRLVFLLFAEDRGLMPNSALYNGHYSIHSLYERLRQDHALHQDTMDDRYGAWAQLLALFRLVFHGHRHKDLNLPPRYGYLFDPNRFPFLEGRVENPHESQAETENPQFGIPLIGDGTIFRLLHGLLFLNGERISYRTLDVEQIGSVYETMMGFGLTRAAGRTIAIRPQKKHGAAVNLDLDQLLSLPKSGSGTTRLKFFSDETGRKLSGKRVAEFNAAGTTEELLAAFQGATANASIIARNATPDLAQPGFLLLQPTDSRRKSGSHYTPRKLTEPIVRKTLEPVLARLGENPFPAQILDLKVCDPAVGSGAFLVETCRQLGDALVKAWALHGGKPVIPPDEDEVLHARRLVAQRCLYGLDRNPMAADLAKLSLWLSTLAKDHPFTFLDHSIRTGDTLVGLSKKQILAFHWDFAHLSAKQTILGQERLEKQIKSALAYRQEILQGGDYVLPEMKAEQLRLADDALAPVRLVGDLAVLAFFSGSKPKERQEARDQLLQRWLKAAEQSGAEESILEGIALKKEVIKARSSEKPVASFHWEIEFPEVFERPNPGFDVFVGNPPFAGHVTMASGNHDEYTNYLRIKFPDSGGKCDLVAFFFREAFSKLRVQGTLGLIGSNTIAEGNTRESGLRVICKVGTIYNATPRLKWPGLAAVAVSVIHIKKGEYTGSIILNKKAANRISAYLLDSSYDDTPTTLSQCVGHSFQGSVVRGMGFTFDDTDKKGIASSIATMNELLNEDPRNAELIFPFIGGDEINSDPRHLPHRYIINFGQRTKEEAQKWPGLFKIAYEKVLPERRKSKAATSSPAIRDFWRYNHVAVDLYDAISHLNQCIAISQVSAHHCFAFLPTNYVYSHALNIFSMDDFGSFAQLQSRIHETWAKMMGSSLEDRMRYTPTSCYETFPLPEDWESNTRLSEIGREYYDYRAKLMVRNNEGLTKTYNRFHDPNESSLDVRRLRELHAAMDLAVLDAYGWTDIPIECDFIPDFFEENDDGIEIPKSIHYRWPDEVRDDILVRLLALNAERHIVEVNAGLHSKGPGKKAAKKAAKKVAAPRKVKQPEPILAGLQEKPWLDVIEALSIEIPTDSRPSLGSSLGYYRVLIPALTQEAGRTLPLELLVSAVTLLEDQDALLGSINSLSEGAKKRWKDRFKESPEAAIFREALRSLAVDSKRIRLVGPKDQLEVRDQPADPIKSPWIIADARLLLKAAVARSASGVTTEVPAEFIKEITTKSRTA